MDGKMEELKDGRLNVWKSPLLFYRTSAKKRRTKKNRNEVTDITNENETIKERQKTKRGVER